jgi:hypothetical protein
MQKTPAAATPQVTATPQAASVAAPLTLEALQTREFALQAKSNELTAQRDVLSEAMRTGSPAVRVTTEIQLVQVNLDLASTKAELSSVRAELATRKGQPQTPQTFIQVPPPAPRTFLDRIDPDALTVAFIVTVLAVLMPLSIGLSRRLWRRGVVPSAPASEDKFAPRFDRLEQAVDTIAIEVERISESQRFMAKVLAERPSTTASASPEAATATPLAEGTPFLALGAGPMETIQSPERQAMRVSVTPH